MKRAGLIRVATYGMPKTVARMYGWKRAPEDWEPPVIPSIAHGFPARRAPATQVVSTVGAVVLLGLARSHQAA